VRLDERGRRGEVSVPACPAGGQRGHFRVVVCVCVHACVLQWRSKGMRRCSCGQEHLALLEVDQALLGECEVVCAVCVCVRGVCMRTAHPCLFLSQQRHVV
jgi:hypothetical protein